MVITCPECGAPAPRLLQESSRDAFVNYYRCDQCGTVWNKPKDADGPIRVVAKYPPPTTNNDNA